MNISSILQKNLDKSLSYEIRNATEEYFKHKNTRDDFKNIEASNKKIEIYTKLMNEKMDDVKTSVNYYQNERLVILLKAFINVKDPRFEKDLQAIKSVTKSFEKTYSMSEIILEKVKNNKLCPRICDYEKCTACSEGRLFDIMCHTLYHCITSMLCLNTIVYNEQLVGELMKDATYKDGVEI